MSAIPDYVEALSVVTSLDDSAVGFANQRTSNFKAFEEAFRAGDSAREHLDWLLKNASGAGKIYSAILIGQLDELAGREACESLLSDETEVEYRSSDIFETRTVGDLATGLLNGEALIIFPPSMKN